MGDHARKVAALARAALKRARAEWETVQAAADGSLRPCASLWEAWWLDPFKSFKG